MSAGFKIHQHIGNDFSKNVVHRWVAQWVAFRRFLALGALFHGFFKHNFLFMRHFIKVLESFYHFNAPETPFLHSVAQSSLIVDPNHCYYCLIIAHCSALSSQRQRAGTPTSDGVRFEPRGASSAAGAERPRLGPN